MSTISAPPNSLLNLLGFVDGQSISASTPAQNSYVFPFDNYVNIWIENIGKSSQEPQQITYKIPIQPGTTYWTNNNVNNQVVNNQNCVFPFSRINISVRDRFGNLLDNNGQDWSFTIKVPDLIHLDTSATNVTKINGNPFQLSITLPVFYKNVTRVELVSAEIPAGFYNIRAPFNTFVVGVTYTVPPGNYTNDSLLNAMNSLISLTSLAFTINNNRYSLSTKIINQMGGAPSPTGTIYNLTVPVTGYYSFLLAGAGITTNKGGTSRYRIINANGARLYFDSVYLTTTDTLSILVGKQGAISDDGSYVNSGGCGGTFISKNNTVLFVAGGAGGIGVDDTIPPYIDACGLKNGRGESLGQWSAFAGSTGYNGTPGSGGNGAQQSTTPVGSGFIVGGGGGGYYSNSFSSNFTTTTSARGFYPQGGAGEVRGASGGFGGGGAGGGAGASGSPGGGGGGGYNGGQGAISGARGTYGGGGSSYYDNTIYTPNSISFTNTGPGYVVVAFKSL